MVDPAESNLYPLVRQLLDRQAESRSLDYKASMHFGPRKKDKGEILKYIIAFANTRDGGYILIGVEQDGGRFIARGVTPDQADSFDPTTIGEFAKNHFSRLPNVTPSIVEVDGVKLLVLRIEEFDDEPIVCTKDLHGDNNQLVLRAGSIYVRTADARCVAIDSGESMRAFLDLAIQKRGDALLKQIRGLMGAPAISEARSGLPEAYQAETTAAADLYNDEGLTDPTPYWYVEILPKAYESERIPTSARLREIRREAIVSIRGWDFPHVDREGDRVFEHGIQSVTHWSQYHEVHRFYYSGLFTWRRQLSEDFTEQYSGSISYVSSIYSITEFFTFASRLASLIADRGTFVVNIGVTGLRNRTLRAPHIFFEDHSTAAGRFDRSYEVSLEELRASHLDLAADAAHRLFDLYDTGVTLNTIQDWQTRFLNRQF